MTDPYRRILYSMCEAFDVDVVTAMHFASIWVDVVQLSSESDAFAAFLDGAISALAARRDALLAEREGEGQN